MEKPKLFYIVDLFAGPGGLSEGFCSYAEKKKFHPFKIVSSVEMDPHAHRTLVLRSFFREFPQGKVPDEYYEYLRGEISRDLLFKKYPKQAEVAQHIAMNVTLGTPDGNRIIRERLKKFLENSNIGPWVLIGGPPCQAYSTIGRSRQQANGIGKEKYQKDHRNFLYREYLQILAEFKPAVFIMENVPGILSAEVGGERIFGKILTDLSRPSNAINFIKDKGEKNLEYKIYSLSVPETEFKDHNPKDYVIKFEDYGIPQARHRVILLGIRKDFDIKPDILVKHPNKVPVKNVVSDLPKLRSDFTHKNLTSREWYDFLQSIPSQPWFNEDDKLIIKNNKGRKINLKQGIRKFLKKLPKHLTVGTDFIKTKSIPVYRKDWYVDKKLKGVINHSTRPHMDRDLLRYFYSAIYANIVGKSPRLTEFPFGLLPNHQNVLHHNGYIKFNDRFHVQLKNSPSRTITCHLSKDGHSSIHYDPGQCRSITVREAARIQTFPDNYFFEGPRTQKFKQVGNAVPPLIAYQIAEIVYNVIKCIKN